MPPAATVIDGSIEGIADVGGIEVEQIKGEDENEITRISVLPREQPKLSESDKHAYFQTMTSGENCYASSFDSVDEIAEDSNEAKLIHRIAQKAILSNENPTEFDETEAQYLDVLDKHIEETNPETISFADLEKEVDDDCHPKKYHSSADEIFEHFLDSPCCQCSESTPTVRRLKSALKIPRWSSCYGKDMPSRQHPTKNNSVKFKNVEISNFRMTLGDHPSACSGPPVRLDWDSSQREPILVDLEKYEQSRQPRRHRRMLKLSLQQRHTILVKERGFSFEEVKEEWQNALEIRRQRKETLERGLGLMKWDEVYESACRKFNRLIYDEI